MSRTLLALLSLTLFSLVGSAQALAEALPKPSDKDFATAVMRRIDDLYRGQSSHGVMEMRVKTRHWKRTMKMEQWSLGTDYSLVRILKPRKERGTATLKARTNLFIYLNKTGRTIKISSGMMGGSWMGSHFTNDDLVRNSRLDRDYSIKLRGKSGLGASRAGARSDKTADAAIYTFALKARRDAPTVWDRLEVSVRVKDLLPVRQVFYNEEGQKVRVLSFSDFRTIGGRVRPGKMTMKPLDKPGELTEVLFTKVDYDVKLTPGFFSLQKLKAL